MSDVHSLLKQKQRKDSNIPVNKDTKEKLKNLGFVKKHTWGEIIEILMGFYEENQNQFEKWMKKKKK